MTTIKPYTTVEIEVIEVRPRPQALSESVDTRSVGEQEKEGSAPLVEAERSDLTVTAPRFDYALVEDEVAEKMRSAAERVHSFTRAAVVEVGRELLAVKEQIEHGQFTDWVQHECGMPIRTAERLMAAAQMVSRNDKLSYLPNDGLLALAGRLAPQPIVAEIVARIDAGERPTVSEIKTTIATAKEVAQRTADRAKRAAEEAKLSPRRRQARQRQRDEQESLARVFAEREAKARAAARSAANMLAHSLGDRLGELVVLLDVAGMSVMDALRAEIERQKPACAEPRPSSASEDEIETRSGAADPDDEIQLGLPFTLPADISPSVVASAS